MYDINFSFQNQNDNSQNKSECFLLKYGQVWALPHTDI